MRLRRQIAFLLAVAVAGVEQAAGGVDAQMIDLVLRPAAAVGVALELMLGGKLAAGAVGGDVALEVGVAAEQAEAVLDLPVDLQAAVGRRLRRRLGGLGQSPSVKAAERQEGPPKRRP